MIFSHYRFLNNTFVAARDPIGIRPLYYGIDSSGYTLFASEPKNLVGLCDMILPFPPGHYYVDGKFVSYLDPSKVERVSYDSSELVSKMIHDRLVEGVRKRLDAQLRKACPLPGLRGVTERVPFGDDREPVVVHGEREGFELLFPDMQGMDFTDRRILVAFADDQYCFQLPELTPELAAITAFWSAQ